jgi:hypothetical protein
LTFWSLLSTCGIHFAQTFSFSPRYWWGYGDFCILLCYILSPFNGYDCMELLPLWRKEMEWVADLPYDYQMWLWIVFHS